MKTKLLLLFIVFSGLQIHAQTQVVSGINAGVGLDYDGSHLYVAELFGNKISRLDITTGAPSLETVTSISRPEGVAVNGNEVSITGISLPGSFRVANVSGGVPTTNSTILTASSIRTVVYDDTHGLYLIQDAGRNGTRVHKVTGTTATQIVTTPVGDVRGATIHGSEMYLSSRGGGSIYKFDLNNVATPTLVKSGIIQPYEIEIANNHLYYASENGQLGKFDLANTALSPSILVNNTLGDLAGLEIIGEDIYFTSWSNNAIYRINDPALAPCVVNIPDANFKSYLVGNTSININGDTEIQCHEASAFNALINVSGLSISDLTGIEAFTSLPELVCQNNQLTTLDLSKNTSLTLLNCSGNQLVELDLSQQNILQVLNCSNNQLIKLDVSNGNNSNIPNARFNATSNPNLACIQADNVAYSTANWTNIDSQTSFNTNCSSLGVNDSILENIAVYPNPTSNFLNIELNEILEKTEVFTLQGQKITESIKKRIDISNLSTGMYLLKIHSSSGKVGVKRFIKN